MTISSYLFQSPYPSQVQFGRPDPSAQQQESQNQAVDSIAQNASAPTQQKADAFLSENKTGASVNVAVASSDSGVSAALEGFTTANTQAQASAAYSE